MSVDINLPRISITRGHISSSNTRTDMRRNEKPGFTSLPQVYRDNSLLAGQRLFNILPSRAHPIFRLLRAIPNSPDYNTTPTTTATAPRAIPAPAAQVTLGAPPVDVASEPSVSDVACASSPVAVGDAEVEAGAMPCSYGNGHIRYTCTHNEAFSAGLAMPTGPHCPVQVALIVLSGVSPIAGVFSG